MMLSQVPNPFGQPIPVHMVAKTETTPNRVAMAYNVLQLLNPAALRPDGNMFGGDTLGPPAKLGEQDGMLYNASCATLRQYVTGEIEDDKAVFDDAPSLDEIEAHAKQAAAEARQHERPAGMELLTTEQLADKMAEQLEHVGLATPKFLELLFPRVMRRFERSNPDEASKFSDDIQKGGSDEGPAPK